MLELMPAALIDVPAGIGSPLLCAFVAAESAGALVRERRASSSPPHSPRRDGSGSRS
jgi:hypothetical protein